MSVPSSLTMAPGRNVFAIFSRAAVPSKNVQGISMPNRTNFTDGAKQEPEPDLTRMLHEFSEMQDYSSCGRT